MPSRKLYLSRGARGKVNVDQVGEWCMRLLKGERQRFFDRFGSTC